MSFEASEHCDDFDGQLNKLVEPPPYIYQPLSDADQQTRFVLLHPGESSDIHIDIKTVDFGDGTDMDYEALSYTWGSQDDPWSVLVHGSDCSTLKVTKNLKKALYELRLKDESRVLWIDAICINQADLDERSKQLRLMAQIYERATRVVAWLGPTSYDSDLALDCFNSINANLAVNWAAGEYEVLRNDTLWADDSETLPCNDQQVLAICNFLYRPWFERLWIWQEIRLGAKRAMLVVGDRNLSWTAFCNAAFLIRHRGMPHTSASARLVPRMEHIHRLCHRQLPMLDALESTRWCKCSDERDRVFTALIIDQDFGSSLAIQSEYAKPTHQVYVEAVSKHLEQHSDLEFLKYLAPEQNMQGLPSWAPDWSAARTVQRLDVSNAAASSQSAACVGMDSTLRCEGIAVAKLAKVVPFQGLDHTLLQGDRLGRKLVQMVDQVTEDEELLRNKDYREVLCRVLTQNNLRNRFAQPIEQQSEACLRETLGMREAALSVKDRQSGRRDLFHICAGRSLCVSDERRFCLAPGAALPGDVIAVLLGCTSAVILRSSAAGTYQVIGEAYYDGVMDGEAVLGPFQDDISIAKQRDNDDAYYHWAYKNESTGELSVDDPRLPELPLDWEKVAHQHDWLYSWFRHKSSGDFRLSYNDPRCDLDALERRGVKFEEFILA
ncbi:hypothetical protein LTR85_002081 [Meristemomyces frigidus]|nr:hypothetical protein LTR85_002081 [Meristemomyces frigidus]